MTGPYTHLIAVAIVIMAISAPINMQQVPLAVRV